MPTIVNHRSSIVDPNSIITIQVKNSAGEITIFKIRNSTTLGKVFTAYAEAFNLKYLPLRFFLSNNTVALGNDQTPLELNMEENDIIYAQIDH